MTGMQELIALRRSGHKPGAVFISLVRSIARGLPARIGGNVDIDIEPKDSLSDLDLRPLVGLHVQVHDHTADPARHRRLCSLVAEANPALLVMPVETTDGFTVHTRSVVDGKTETRTQRL